MTIISFQDAVKAARSALDNLFADDPVRDVALEEIELVTEGSNELWAVTLGYYKKRSVSSTNLGALAYFQPPDKVENRVYKTLFINAETGDFVKMSLRIV